MIQRHIVLRFTLVIGLSMSTHAAVARIVLDSDEGDYIGRGEATELLGPFTTSATDSQLTISDDEFRMSFVAPDGRSLAPGVFIDAERTPFSGPYNPGIEVTRSSSGCNTIDGQFIIYEYETEPLRLAVDFTQYCDSLTSALRGSIRINSSVSVPYNLPLPVVTTSRGLPVEDQPLSLSAARSVVNNGPFTVAWQQLAGPTVRIEQPNQVETELTFVDGIPLGGTDMTFSVTVTDAGGSSASAQHVLTVASKSDPMTFLAFESEAGDYIGQGRSWYYSPADSLFLMNENFDNGVGIQVENNDYWNIDFAAPFNAQLQVGNYPDAARPEDKPGLGLYGDGRGCNKNYGFFDVSNLVWEGGAPVSLRARELPLDQRRSIHPDRQR